VHNLPELLLWKEKGKELIEMGEKTWRCENFKRQCQPSGFSSLQQWPLCRVLPGSPVGWRQGLAVGIRLLAILTGRPFELTMNRWGVVQECARSFVFHIDELLQEHVVEKDGSHF
jgi:hypothetical protein